MGSSYRDQRPLEALTGDTNAPVYQVLGPFVSAGMAVDGSLHRHQVGDVLEVGTFRPVRDSVLVLYIPFRIPRRPRPSTVVTHGLT